MVNLHDIVQYLDNYLNIENIKDDSWNGLQIEGKNDVNKVMFAVDAGIEVFERAVSEKVDLVVVHHGMFWRSCNPSVRSWNKKRVEFLINNGISLYASHLPLDKHFEVGNNIQLLSLLGFKEDREFGEYGGEKISFIGKSESPKSIKIITKILQEKLLAKCIVLPFGKKDIYTIAVCSGGGNYPIFMEAVTADVDCYITGDSTEMYHMAKDIGINVIFAGHHATETVGVKALSFVVKEKFGLETLFVDIPTGL